MSVVPLPLAAQSGPPRLELLSYVIAAISLLGEPAALDDLAGIIAEGLDRAEDGQVRREVADILAYYCDRDLAEPVQGRMLARVGDRFAFTPAFKAHLTENARLAAAQAQGPAPLARAG
jgi:hypothetical protein